MRVNACIWRAMPGVMFFGGIYTATYFSKGFDEAMTTTSWVAAVTGAMWMLWRFVEWMVP